ncbi:MAG TPA: DUF192 domain-containing protein, partial [Alphaproteobacteria bacterium]|nr:DUF192 domain-containing protein [Alphaproteobacteria bacterium]
GTKTHEFKVELAISVRQRMQGLMWRKRLPPDSGMLFIYPGNQVIEMWMKNTLIPLDMLFIDKTGKIVRIRERAVPQSVKVISSGQKVKGVLELAGGTVSKLGLKTGDRILHPAFGTQ